MTTKFTFTTDFLDDYDEIFGEDFAENCQNLHLMMKQLNWKWFDPIDNTTKVPSISTIEKDIRKMFKELMASFEATNESELAQEGNGIFVFETGGIGFELGYNLKNKEIIFLSIKFDIWGHSLENGENGET